MPASSRLPPVNNQIMYVLCLYVELKCTVLFFSRFRFHAECEQSAEKSDEDNQTSNLRK